MPNNLFSFTGVQPNPDQTYQAGLNQYQQQGQAMIDPGKAALAQASPLTFAGTANLARAFQQAQQQGPQMGAPSVGTAAPVGNLPVAPGQYQSQPALENANGKLYPTPYAAQQAQPWLQRMASALMGS